MKAIHNKYDSAESLKLFEGMTLKIFLTVLTPKDFRPFLKTLLNPV